MPSKDAQELFMAALNRAYERACEALLRDHAALARTEHDNQRVLNNRCPTLPKPSSSEPLPRTTSCADCPALSVWGPNFGLFCCGSRKVRQASMLRLESVVPIRLCVQPSAAVRVHGTSMRHHACGLLSYDVSHF